MCKYLDISSRTIQRWRKNGLTDKRKGASKNVPKNAKLIFWGNNDITARSTFITHKKIQIGVNTVISWDCLFMDTDFHNVLHHSEIMNPDREITIGNNCWIGCRCTILTDFILPDNCVLGANSVGTKRLDCENSLYAGNPAILKKNNITWNG